MFYIRLPLSVEIVAELNPHVRLADTLARIPRLGDHKGQRPVPEASKHVAVETDGYSLTAPSQA